MIRLFAIECLYLKEIIHYASLIENPEFLQKQIPVKVCVFNSQKSLPIYKNQVKKVVKEVVTFEGSCYDEYS
jgi:hypothetical protein